MNNLYVLSIFIIFDQLKHSRDFFLSNLGNASFLYDKISSQLLNLWFATPCKYSVISGFTSLFGNHALLFIRKHFSISLSIHGRSSDFPRNSWDRCKTFRRQKTFLGYLGDYVGSRQSTHAPRSVSQSSEQL